MAIQVREASTGIAAERMISLDLTGSVDADAHAVEPVAEFAGRFDIASERVLTLDVGLAGELAGDGLEVAIRFVGECQVIDDLGCAVASGRLWIVEIDDRRASRVRSGHLPASQA